MEDTMFRDEDDLIWEEIKALLKVYPFEEVLEMNEMTDDEALLHLYLDGHITLPEVKPL